MNFFSKRPGVGVMLVVGIVAQACIPPTGVPPTTAPPSVPLNTLLSTIEQLPTDASRACADIVAFDGGIAYKNAAEDQPILWTFGVNFEVQLPDSPAVSPESTLGAPLACFKLYQRNDGTAHYELIDSFFIDTCAIIETVSISSGEAVFDGGYIKCDMDLAGWVNSLAAATTESESDLKALLQKFSEPQSHTYGNFTMVAKMPGTSIAADNQPADLPLMAYFPVGAPNTVQSPILALTAGAIDTASFCRAESEANFYYYDLRTQAPNQVYRFQYIASTSSTECGVGQATHPFNFWIGEATLYIGYNPATGIKFPGVIDGVLLDPTDSKPPE